jgi:hypothetical protein
MRISQKKGMERKNLLLSDNNVIIARTLGSMGYSLADGVKHTQQSHSSSPFMSIMKLQHQTQMQDPKFQRKEMKRKYMNKSYKLQKGDWGYITQSLLDYAYLCNKTTFSQLKQHYDITLRGNTTIQKGGSFIHHLQALVKRDNAENRRCRRFLTKGTDGKYQITYY